jgi:hypothetical protein
MSVPPYGPALRAAAASGDVDKMRDAHQQAEQYLQEYGNVSAALEALKIAIAKAEGGAGQ